MNVVQYSTLSRSIPFVLAFLAIVTLGSVDASSREVMRPNIVLMLVDDMGVMDTSVPFLTDETGQPKRYPLNDFYRTPNLERIAKQGTRFSTFYAMSVCSPTRISIMTGQNAARHRTTNWINPNKDNGGQNGPPNWNWQGLKKSDVTLARLFQKSGYRTIHIGKGHFGPNQSEGSDPRNVGFDVNIGGTSAGQPASYYGQKNFGNAEDGPATRTTSAVPDLKTYHGQDIFLTEALTREAKKEIDRSVSEQKPFFLYFPQYAVHGPFQSDSRFADHYTQSGKPANAQAFATLVEGVDKSLGDIVSHLIEIGIAENTLVVFLGDNGTDAPLGHQHEVACAAPLRGRKGSHYEGGMRVPFLATWAKPSEDNLHQRRFPIKADHVQVRMGVVYDLFPTLLEIADIAQPESYVVDGKSLTKLLAGGSEKVSPESFLMHYPHQPHRSDHFTVYREDDWKVIYHYFPTAVSDGSSYQLFRLSDDPFEQNDLSKSEPDQLRRMMAGLRKTLHNQHALLPVDGHGNPVVIPEN
jgi:arylsulfatase A-like enzyme